MAKSSKDQIEQDEKKTTNAKKEKSVKEMYVLNLLKYAAF